jgi:hypothetical protein
MTGVGDSSLVPPTLMSASTLRIELRKNVGRYPINSGDGFLVGSADYEEFREQLRIDPPPSRWTAWLWKGSYVTCRRLTIRTPNDEAVCVLDQRGLIPRKSGFRFLRADETSIGAYRADWIFDRYDRRVAQYQPHGWRRPGQVVAVEGDQVATIRSAEKTSIDIDFITPTAAEFRLLIICTAFALRVISESERASGD